MEDDHSEDVELTLEVIKLLGKIKEIKRIRARSEQALVRKRIRNESSAIYDDKGNLRGQVKAFVDPVLANELMFDRWKHDEYMRRNGLSPFSDPDFLPYLQKHDDSLRVDFKTREGKIFLSGMKPLKSSVTILDHAGRPCR